MNKEFELQLTALLNQAKSKKMVNADIKTLEKAVNPLKLVAAFSKAESKKELNAYIKLLSNQLSTLKLKAKIDNKNLKREINTALRDATLKDIDLIKVDENKTKLKVRKIIADAQAYVNKHSISVNVGMKKEKLNNDLTTFLNKNTKIRESSVLLEESERIRELINSVDDRGTLKNATEAFQLYKSEVSATGYATTSTTDKIKAMLSHVTKIGSFFGLASLAVNNFRKSLSTLKGNDTILTEISKTSEMTKRQLEELGNEAFKVASKYGQLSSGYLLGVQEMARSGYEDLSKELGELSLLTQAAGNMTAENANNYLLATDAAYKYGGSIEKLNAALDGANFISNRNSASLTDIADATRVTASFAANAGVAIDEMTAAEATMIAVTKRAGSEIGRSFRSIILNLQQVSGEFDGEVIDEEQLKKVEARCHSLGVELEYMKDGVATLRNPMEVLKDLSKIYNSLPDNSADKQGLISDLGGKYHANALSSLLSRWDLYEKMLGEFSQGTGSALEEAEKTANSWEGRLNSLQNSWDSFVSTLTNKEAIMGGISFFDRLIQGAETLTDSVGEITVMMGVLGTAMTAMNKDYGITQVYDKDKGKIDIQGNIFGIDITNIKNMKKHFSEAEEAIAGWNAELLTGNADINKFNEAVVQNNAQLKEYLSTCSKDAPASLEGYRSYLNSIGVATDGLRLKTVMLNAAISFGIGFAMQLAGKFISAAIEKIDDLSHSTERCKERVDELMSNYQSALDKANSNAKTIEELAEKYETLSKGVNNLGENVSLTTDEYSEYNKIVNQIADMFPTLVQGYTNEGNAILSLKGNVEQLRDAYKEAQQEAYNMLIISGKDSDGNDIIENYQDIINGSNDIFGNKWSRGAAEKNDAYREFLDAIVSRDVEQIEAIVEKHRSSATSSNWLLDSIGLKWSDLYDTKGLVATEEELYSIQQQIKSQIQTNQAEIDSGLKNVQTLANAYLMTNEDYAKLDDQSKNAASIIINSIDESIANSFERKVDVGEYVSNIVDTLRNNPEVKDALVNLFQIDTSEMQPDDVKAIVDQYINFIANAIGEDPLELKIRLGFDDVDTIASNYRTVMRKAAEKFATKTPSAKESRISYDAELNALAKFAEENSINTQDEIAFWNKCIEESNTREEAMQKYLSSSFTDENSLFSTFTNSDFGTRIQHITDLFNEGTISHKEYFDALQSEIDNFDASNFTNSIEDMDKASAQFFVDSMQQAASGLSGLINSFDKGEMSISEYLEGYLAIGNTLSTLTDNLQENSAAWNEHGEAISEVGNTALDDTQNKLSSAMSIIESYQDSIYSLEQIMNDAVTVGSDEFTAHANVIAEDLYHIVQTGGEMADTIASTLGTTTSEIAQSLTENVSNQEIACQAIMANTNNAITDMSSSIGELFDTLGDAISNFKVDLSFGVKSIDWKKVNVLGAELSLPEIKFELGASGESLDKIGSALSSFGKTIASNYTPQTIELEDFHFGSTDAAKDRKYSPSSGITKNYEDALGRIKDATKSTSSAAKSEFSEMVDFFKRRIDELDDALSLLKTNLDNVSGSFAKNNLVDAQLNITEEKFNNYTDALAMYTQKANEALSKLPSDIAAKVKDGAVALTDFIGDGNKDVVEAIKEYESWAGEISDCKQELAELQKEIRQLELSKFTNIMDDYQNQFNLRGNSKDLISKQIALLKEAGELIGESFFKTQIDQSQKQLELLENEKAQLVNQMSSAINSGRIQKGTAEWLSMVDSLQSVDSSILDCKKSIEEFDNELLSLHTQIFDRIQEQFSNLNSEISNIMDLFDEFDVSDDKGIWSKEAIAQLGLLTQQYELAQYQVQQYNNEIDELNKQYLAGRYSATEYADRLATLNSEQWSAVKSSESALSAIMDLNEARVNNAVKGIEKEIDSYKELINAQLDAIDKEEKLRKYKNDVADKNKMITDLERQISAVQYDTSASGIAKLKQLQQKLADAKADLEETEHERSVELQKDALNTQLENYQKTRDDEITALRESLNDKETILATSFNTVKENASLVGQEIATIATEHGVTVSNALISSWQSGETAIASYGQVLSQNTSAFIGNIMGVENEVWNLQAQANVTADSLAWMFSTKADNLVNELTISYYTEANLANMTNALQQSLVNTLERGYDVSSIVNSLNSITDAANTAANAVSRVGNMNAGASSSNTSGGQKALGVGVSGSIAGIAGGLRTNKAYQPNGYANGTRNSKGNLIITDEDGYEMKLPKLQNGQYTLANEGSQVFTKEQTDRLYELANTDNRNLIPFDPFKDDLFKIWGNVNMPEPAIDRRMSAPINNHYDSMFAFNGAVIDAERALKQMEKVAGKIADQRIDKHDNKMYDAIKYRRY